MTDFTALPDNLPMPRNDGAADHLPGRTLPPVSLADSGGDSVDLAASVGSHGHLPLPAHGRPGVDLPEGWDAVPGARGCSTEACDFRDHFAEPQAAGAMHVRGLSSQDPEYQAEVVERLRLPSAGSPTRNSRWPTPSRCRPSPHRDMTGCTRASRSSSVAARSITSSTPIFPPGGARCRDRGGE